MLRKPHYIALGLVLLLTLTILNLPGTASARLKHAIGGLFLPLFGLASSSRQLAENAGEAVTPRSQLLKENESLRRENQELRFQAMQAAETQRENNRLRDLLKWRELNHTWNLRSATVIARDPANWWSTAQIDLGSRDGMQTNLPVLNSAGLVGKIS
jgi:rod shape-determining protein MreC